MTKLILIEGIPGSGKTTIAQKVAERYRNRSRSVNLYLESEAHPADLGWSACVPAKQYNGILEKYPALHKKLESFEVYDGCVPDETFYRLHFDRWRKFRDQAAHRIYNHIYPVS